MMWVGTENTTSGVWFRYQTKETWNICLIICYHHQTRSGNIKAKKTHHISVKAQVFFRKNLTTIYLAITSSKPFYISFVDIFFWDH